MPLPFEFITCKLLYIKYFVLGATGVDNGKGGGWCHDMVGAHSVKLNGRTYSFLPPATAGVGPSGGLSYFTFDSRAALKAHGASRNRKGDNEEEEYDGGVFIDNNLLTEIYKDLAKHNVLCKDVANFGKEAHLKAIIDGTAIFDGTTSSDVLTAIAKVCFVMDYFSYQIHIRKLLYM